MLSSIGAFLLARCKMLSSRIKKIPIRNLCNSRWDLSRICNDLIKNSVSSNKKQIWIEYVCMHCDQATYPSHYFFSKWKTKLSEFRLLRVVTGKQYVSDVISVFLFLSSFFFSIFIYLPQFIFTLSRKTWRTSWNCIIKFVEFHIKKRLNLYCLHIYWPFFNLVTSWLGICIQFINFLMILVVPNAQFLNFLHFLLFWNSKTPL